MHSLEPFPNKNKHEIPSQSLAETHLWDAIYLCFLIEISSNYWIKMRQNERGVVERLREQKEI